MIKIYSPPTEITAPAITRCDTDTYLSECKAYTQSVKDWCIKHSKNRHAGEVISFPVADGQARYVVFSPGKLVHLQDGDAYDFPYIDRLNASDILEKIKQAKALDKLFSAAS